MVDIIGFLSFFGIVAVAYLGLFLGRLILFIAPEENLPGKPWFKLLSSVLLAGMLYSSSSSFILSIMLALTGFFFILMFSEKVLKDKLMSSFLYGILGIVIGVAIYTSPLRIITASLVFMFLMAYSSLTFFPKSNDVNLKKYRVKNKMKYLKEIMFPFVTMFISLFLFIIGF